MVANGRTVTTDHLQMDNKPYTVVLKMGLMVNLNYRSLVLKRGYYASMDKNILVKKNP